MRLSWLAILGVVVFSIGACSSNKDTLKDQMRKDDDQARASGDAIFARMKAEAEAEVTDMRRKFESYLPQLRAYAACNQSASQRVSSQSGDPGTLAIAARTLCFPAETELQKAISTAYANNPSQASKTMEDIRKQAIENNIGRIVGYRIKNEGKSEQRSVTPSQKEQRI